MNILIGSCGGLVGSYLSRQFKKMGNIVFGMDTSFPNVTSAFLDKEIEISKASDPSFFDSLIKILNENKIDCYIPTNSKEIVEVSKIENNIREKWNGFFIVCPYETFELLDGKKDANINLSRIGIPVPRLYETLLSDDKYPIFMKPENGSGSKSSFLIADKRAHEVEINKRGTCFFEYIEGKEYTVDCFFGLQGELISYNQRIRLKSMGGAVIVTKNDYSFDIYPYLKKISKAFVFKGCVNFQYILKNNTPYFIDVNLRYASGGLPLSVKSGVNVPAFLVDLTEGKQIKTITPSLKNDGLTMYRYFEEWYK